VDGFLNLYKPAGWTSHDCVAKVRRILRQKKVGHGGTLDPMATGVLPIALGRATRLLQYLPEDKTYRATVRFGLRTTTDDVEGEIITSQIASQLTETDVIAPLTQFIGKIEQIPPQYSAIQVNGQRLYDLARSGVTINVPKRIVQINQLDATDWRSGDHPELDLTVACGAGTYIRSIARDLGEHVGTGATLAKLERTHSCGLDRVTSLTLDDLMAQVDAGTFTPIAPAVALADLTAIALPPELARRWQLGQKLDRAELPPETLNQPSLTQIPNLDQGAETEFNKLGNEPENEPGNEPEQALDRAASDGQIVQITTDQQEFLGVGVLTLDRLAPKMVYVPPISNQ